jgi:hypothetical protein
MEDEQKMALRLLSFKVGGWDLLQLVQLIGITTLRAIQDRPRKDMLWFP